MKIYLISWHFYVLTHPTSSIITNLLAQRSENSHPSALEKGRKSAVLLIDLQFIG